jgi:hypothetical protein
LYLGFPLFPRENKNISGTGLFLWDRVRVQRWKDAYMEDRNKGRGIPKNVSASVF